MKQWVMRITDYADRLLEDLEDLDWPESIKSSQRNWIGKSEGAEISFQVDNNNKIDVFTTRPDTIFGATYLVLAPEHPILDLIVAENQKEEINKYKEIASQRVIWKDRKIKKIRQEFLRDPMLLIQCQIKKYPYGFLIMFYMDMELEL